MDDGHQHHQQVAQSLNRTALQATLHCLTGCAIGEVLGMVIGTALGLSNLMTIILAAVLAFMFGYALTLILLIRANIAFGTALGLAFAADTVSITIMEIVDNGGPRARPRHEGAPVGLQRPKPRTHHRSGRRRQGPHLRHQ